MHSSGFAVCLEFEIVESSVERQTQLLEEPQVAVTEGLDEQNLTEVVAWLKNVALEIEVRTEDLIRLRARRDVWLEACCVVVADERFVVKTTCPWSKQMLQTMLDC